MAAQSIYDTNRRSIPTSPQTSVPINTPQTTNPALPLGPWTPGVTGYISDDMYRRGPGNTTSPIPTPGDSTGTGDGTPNVPTPIPAGGAGIQITPAAPLNGSPTQISVSDFASQLVTEPEILLNEQMRLSGQVPQVSQADIAAGTIDPATGQPTTPTPQAVVTTGQPTAAGVTAPISAADVATRATYEDIIAQQNQLLAAQGIIAPGAQIDAAQIDTTVTGLGQNQVGQALTQSANQNISNIIDTSTTAGKLLAEQLGEGEYIDARATMKGQLDILASEFIDASTGDPVIPSWAAGAARNVSRIAAFSGMTGTAAVAAMSQALLEASLPIAQQDSQFFQTVTMENLSNRQQSIINRANVLSKMDLANLDNRMVAAVENSKSFMQMDMANLSNEQQSVVINNQSRIQSILEDAKVENANRLFIASSQNEKDMFYGNLNAAIDQFNASQSNAMEQFNSGETNTISQFNANLESAREQFYKNMQFQVDTANAQWRQTVTLTENQQTFEAAATDVKNLVGISVEQLNQIWDRSDALLDYVWKTADNDADRKNQLALVQLQGNIDSTISDQEGTGNIIGTILGAGSSAFFDWLF